MLAESGSDAVLGRQDFIGIRGAEDKKYQSIGRRQAEQLLTQIQREKRANLIAPLMVICQDPTRISMTKNIVAHAID